MTDEERYAAELDSAFDDYDALPRAETPPRVDPDNIDDLAGGTVAGTTSSGRTARERSAARRAGTPIRSEEDDELRVAPARRPNNLLWILVGIVALLLVVFLLFQIPWESRQRYPDSREPDSRSRDSYSRWWRGRSRRYGDTHPAQRHRNDLWHWDDIRHRNDLWHWDDIRHRNDL